MAETLGALGWSGIMAFALSFVFRHYVKTVEARVDSLERRAGDCEADRRELHKQMKDILLQDGQQHRTA